MRVSNRIEPETIARLLDVLDAIASDIQTQCEAQAKASEAQAKALKDMSKIMDAISALLDERTNAR